MNTQPFFAPFDSNFAPTEAIGLYVNVDTIWVKEFLNTSRKAGSAKSSECVFDIDGKTYECSISLLKELLAPYVVKQ